MSNDKLVVCGIDIGYSNVKIAVGGVRLENGKYPTLNLFL